MSNNSAHRVNLVHRIDTLIAILNRLEKKPDSEKAARDLVTLIRASSASRQMTDLAQCAQRAESASSADFADRLRDLIELMREEVRRNKANPATVLIVSTDASLKSALSDGLLAAHQSPVTASTPSEALAHLEAGAIGFTIIDLVMEGADGRDFIVQLRQRASMAAMPVLAIGPAINNPETESTQPPGADAFFVKPVDPDAVIKYLNLWLKRGYMRGHASRRDPTTGTPNRAGCHEAYQQIQMQCAPADPISFALVGIHRFNALSRSIGPVARDSLIKQVGSILSSTFRATDVVARWNVSEFAVILPAEDQFGGTRALEKALAALNGLSTTTPSGKTLPVTLCGGLTLVDNQTPIEDAEAAAERNLFMAFHNAWHAPGTNQLVSDAVPNGRRSEVIALYLSDISMARTLKQVLEHETFEVELFSSAESLQARLATRSFNLLILDEGHTADQRQQLLERAREIPGVTRMKVLLVVSGDTDVATAFRPVIQDYAIKPVSITAFLSRVRHLLWDHQASLSQARMNILIVDHEIPQLMVAGTTLHQMGECRVQLARGFQDGLSQLAHSTPHLLLLDTTMPGMSAADFIKAIPELPSQAGLSIILASPHPRTAAIAGTPFKVLGCVSRPYKPTSLLMELRALVPSLDNETTVALHVDPTPLEAEIRRIISLRATGAGS